MKEIEFSAPLSGKEWETASTYTLPDGSKTSTKPEAMTQLLGNKLVYKDDPRIILRGKLDSFQAQCIALIYRYKDRSLLADQLKELVQYSMLILKHEVLDTPLPDQKLLSWTYKEIRERSHNPAPYYGLKQMVLVNEDFPLCVIELNIFRALIREIELTAVQAFRQGDQITRNDLVLALNRMSSCFHILMYQELASSLLSQE